eukprot:3838673-Prorocentrum_lima.AAC.1
MIKLATLQKDIACARRRSLVQSGKWRAELSTCVHLLVRVRAEMASAMLAATRAAEAPQTLVDGVARGDKPDALRALGVDQGGRAALLVAE